jgi:hypothetical protein
VKASRKTVDIRRAAHGSESLGGSQNQSPSDCVTRPICLLAADGLPNRTIAQNLKTSRRTVGQWRPRLKEWGPEGLAKKVDTLLEKVAYCEAVTVTPRQEQLTIRFNRFLETLC